MFKRTTAINKLKGMTARKKIVQGGTSAGKTYGIIPILIDKAAKDTTPTKTAIVAETLPAVKEGALDIFKQIMFETNRWNDAHWNASSLTYTFGNKSRIQFKSFDTVGKAKSAGKRDRLFLNEANHIPFAIADALMIRSKETWIDFNPDNEFWAHTEVLPEPNSEFLLLTYKDNEACPPETVEDLQIKISKAFIDPEKDWNNDDNVKSPYWANWCRVYILGQIGALQGVIFSNWTIIDDIPEEARKVGHGLDFGYTNDPAAIVDVYKWNDKRILDLLAYGTGMSNKKLASFITDKLPCYCDSAEPKSIQDLKDHGVNAKPVTKGGDSINYGIQIMQDQEYLVTARSVALITELRKYSWATDKATNTPTNDPIDDFNHAVDAIRYHEMEAVGLKKNKGKYSIG